MQRITVQVRHDNVFRFATSFRENSHDFEWRLWISSRMKGNGQIGFLLENGDRLDDTLFKSWNTFTNRNNLLK